MTTPKTVRIQDHEGDWTHWEFCRYEECIAQSCPRYERCCGEVGDV
jgi:hypothetical protein